MDNAKSAAMKARGKNIWRIRKGSPLPDGIKAVKELANEGHFYA